MDTVRRDKDVSLPCVRHLMKSPRSQRVWTVRIAAVQLAQRAKQALAVSSPSFLARTILLPASEEYTFFGILPKSIEILRATRRPGDSAGFALHEFQHFPNTRNCRTQLASTQLAEHHPNGYNDQFFFLPFAFFSFFLLIKVTPFECLI